MSDLEIQRGQSVRWPFTMLQADDQTPLDLTGATWEVLENFLGSDVVISVVVTDAARGVSEITIAKESTAGVRVGNKTLRLRVCFPSGEAVALPALSVTVK